MWRILPRAAMAAAIAILWCQSLLAQPRGLGRLAGQTTSETGTPLGGVAVRIPVEGGTIEATTDDSGHWAVVGIGKGQFVIEFSKSGFESKRVRLVVERETLKPEPVKTSLRKS